MIHQVTRYTDALSAFENWNLTDFASKKEDVSSLIEAMGKVQSPSEDADWNAGLNVMRFQLARATSLLAHCHELPGPTGETNELYTAGRGVTVLIQEEKSAQAKGSVLAQLTTALLAGNSVILCSDDDTLCTALEDACTHSSLPTHVLQVAPLEAYPQLLESDIRCIGYVGQTQALVRLNRQLAKRSGAIVSLVSETDLSALPVAQDPHLALRFITERTRTINITAVGGNATLLELGSESH
ncbi:1-pyrroline-5-carboxylate dehydrogenase [Vibrio cholerae]